MIGQRLMNWATFSCKVATEMIEKRAVVKLTATEKIKLSVHIALCKTCNAYQNESALIDLSIEKQMHAQRHQKNQLPDTFKTDLIDKLENKSE